MSKLRTLIVDDEPLICDELRCALTVVQDIEVTGIVHNAQDAVKIAAIKPIDLVFLDIQMPGMNGLELAQKLSGQPRPPLIVFITAYSDFALDAFAVDAVDYILKPFDERDITRVLKKIRGRHVRYQAPPPRLSGPVRNLCVEAGDRLEVIHTGRIQVIQADERQVFLRTVEGRTFPVRRRLNELEQMLDPKDFYRCHRNYIVNVNQVHQVASWFNRGYLLIMKEPAAEVPVGRVYAPRLKEYLPL